MPLYQAEGVDLQDPSITDYPGTGPATDALFLGRNPATGKDHRVTGARMPGVGASGGLPAGAALLNIADVPAAKRIQVVNDIATSVSGGGQAMIQETDKSYAGKRFKDNRTPGAPYLYTADQESNPSTGLTEVWWNRTRIQ